MVLILYTTLYREGGAQFQSVAQTMADSISASGKNVRLVRVESKKEAVRQLVESSVLGIQEFHFIGHSGLYGPMFGTIARPEQLSPYEWRSLRLSFHHDAVAFFHCCRSARWFAPFFARTFGVTSFGYYWYTTFSESKERFRIPKPWRHAQKPLYVFGCPGKKSHGIFGSLGKYTGFVRPEKPKRFLPVQSNGAERYDGVAKQYARVFNNIEVRHAEIEWFSHRLHQLFPTTKPDVLDIGCGSGSMLDHFAHRFNSALGIDISKGMLMQAERKLSRHSHISLAQVAEPVIPAADGQFDLVMSMLSFRYLDWDPLMAEFQRVLRPNGRLLLVDMVAKPAALHEYPRALFEYVRDQRVGASHRGYLEERRRLVSSKTWKDMVAYNPVRAEHEYLWYLGSRFPKGHFSILRISRRVRIIAFDSDRFSLAQLYPMSYP